MKARDHRHRLAIFVSETIYTGAAMQKRSWTSRKTIVLALLALFLLPLAARAAIFAFEDRPHSWRDADWSSIGSLPPAERHPEARVLVLSGRTGGWKGVVAVHSWIVIKRENGRDWTRYDVVGWGNPVRVNGWAPDGRWYGDRPVVIADLKGAAAEKLIPRIEAAITAYRFHNAGDYRIWPGPNSNTFVAHRAAGYARARRDPAGKRHRPRLPSAGVFRPHRQRHRRGSELVGTPRAQARLGRGCGIEFPRTCRRPRSAEPGAQAAGHWPAWRGRAGGAGQSRLRLKLTAFSRRIVSTTIRPA